MNIEDGLRYEVFVQIACIRIPFYFTSATRRSQAKIEPRHYLIENSKFIAEKHLNSQDEDELFTNLPTSIGLQSLSDSFLCPCREISCFTSFTHTRLSAQSTN